MKAFMKAIIKRAINKSGWTISRTRNSYPMIPVEASEFQAQLITSCGKLSMTGPVRMWSVLQALDHINRNGIVGDCVECGVWKGGNLALMSLYSKFLGMKNSVIGFDTFDGMPEADEIDEDLFGNSAKDSMKISVKDESITNIHAYATINQVEQNLKLLGVDNVKLVQGKVENTLRVSENVPEQISLLRLDTDWYESTKDELDILYPKLQSGGVLIIDDYGHFKGARKAVDEYFEQHNIWKHYIDYTCRLIVKP